MDIGSGSSYPSCTLSNFDPHPFIYDGIACMGKTKKQNDINIIDFDKIRSGKETMLRTFHTKLLKARKEGNIKFKPL